MYNRVYNHLKAFYMKNNLVFKKITEHAILQLARDITDFFENEEYTLKAFDTADHQILV